MDAGTQTHFTGLPSTTNSTLSLSTTHDSITRNSHDVSLHASESLCQPESQDITGLHRIPTTRPCRDSYMGEALENLANTMSAVESRHPEDPIELGTVPSRRSERSATRRSIRHHSPPRLPDLAEEGGSPTQSKHQGVPAEIGSLTAEVIFVMVCSAGLLLFSSLLGDITVNQEQFKRALGISNSELPWLLGAYTTPLSLSVIISGSLSDLTPPRMLMVGAFAWLTIWNIVGVFSIKPSMAILFYMVRAMQGLSIGVLVSGSMSILGRVYKPGLRKNQVRQSIRFTVQMG